MLDIRKASRFEAFSTFKSKLHKEWRRNREIRRKLPLSEAWRGCMGLAILIDQPDNTVAHGELALARNTQLTWLAMRDVPRGHFPGSPAMNRRDVNYVNKATADLRYGMPYVDFKTNLSSAVDFKFMPFSRYTHSAGAKEFPITIAPSPDTLDSSAEREFAVLNRLNDIMTEFAFSAVDFSGRPVRPAWAKLQAKSLAKPRPFIRPEVFAPRPYIGIPAAATEQLFHTVTRSEGTLNVWECPTCRHITDNRTFARSARCDSVVFETGDFAATCPNCNKRRKWFLSDAIPCRTRRRFSLAFSDAFLATVRGGLSVSTIGEEIYAGVAKVDRDRLPVGDSGYGRMDLVRHCLVDTHDANRRRYVFLPRYADITARAGELLPAGERWAKLTRRPPRWWSSRNADEQWATLHQVLGGVDYVGYYQQLWFNHQAVQLQEEKDQWLFPAELLGTDYRRNTPAASLWWDTAPALPYFDMDLSTAVLPAVPVRQWQRLRFDFPGEVVLDASIADPRFAAAR